MCFHSFIDVFSLLQSRKYYFLSEEAYDKEDLSHRCRDLEHQVGCTGNLLKLEDLVTPVVTGDPEFNIKHSVHRNLKVSNRFFCLQREQTNLTLLNKEVSSPVTLRAPAARSHAEKLKVIISDKRSLSALSIHHTW